MNLIHLKYAVEVAATGSVNKAAEKLYIGQPNLSRAIRELEASLGVTIFDRSAKGMDITPDGEVFINYAKSILKQVDEIEEIFKKDIVNKKKFSISVPRASYIADAFARFSNSLNEETDVEILYKETNSMRAIKNILQEDYKLGIIRYAQDYDKYYKSMLEEKGFIYEMIAEFTDIVIMNKNHPIAKKDEFVFSDLQDYIEITHADPFVPSIPFSEIKKDELPNIRKHIFVFERASQFELLSQNKQTFMFVSPVPDEILKRYGLVQKKCKDNKKIYKDVLIHRKDYKLSKLDNLFISELCKSKRETFI